MKLKRFSFWSLTALFAVTVMLALPGCSMGNNDPPPELQNDSVNGVMNLSTAEKVFGKDGFREYTESVEIIKFNDVAALGDYLKGAGRQAGPAASATFKINSINGKPVTIIRPGAFKPDPARNGSDDISRLAAVLYQGAAVLPDVVIVLPDELDLDIEALAEGGGLFEGVGGAIKVEIPTPVIERILEKEIDKQITAEGLSGTAAEERKQEIKEALAEESPGGAAEALVRDLTVKLTETIQTAVGKGAGEAAAITIEKVAPTSPAPANPEAPVVVVPELPPIVVEPTPAAPGNSGEPGNNGGNGEQPSTPSTPSTPSSPSSPSVPLPSLTSTWTVTYDAGGKPTVAFVFNAAVTTGTVTGSGWTVTGTGSTTITAEYTGGQYGMQTVSFTAARSGYTSASVSASVVSARAFPSGGAAAAYTIEYYDPALHVAAVRKVDGDTVDGFLVADAAWQKLFNAIYTPNAPGSSTDAMEDGKTAVSYNADISAAALKLFNVTIGGSSQPSGKVEIKGTVLPTAGGASSTNPIVIDIGVPGTVDNGDLNFVIPKNQGLGASSGDYGHLRLRVNKGASLLIEADNSGYINNGPSEPCPTGNFNYGTVEVMAGGKLRDGAYNGFPLGANAVILTRYNSYLGIGPEAGSDDATSKTKNTDAVYSMYYAGWLVGPSGDSPKIEWDVGGAANDYLEVRQGKLAISTSMTVKQTVGLIYSVWIVGDVTITIDAVNAATPIGGTGNNKGLFANGDTFKIYGTTNQAKIVVNEGSVLDTGFLTDGPTDVGTFIPGPKTPITNIGTGKVGNYADGISGYLNWNIPE